MRAMTKSPIALAREALAIGKTALPEYSHASSPKKFTQPQLFAILVLRMFFRMDYRGMTELLRDFADLRRVLELKRVPHYSTLCLAEQRLLKTPLSSDCSALYFAAREHAA